MTKRVHEVELVGNLSDGPQYFWVEQKKEIVVFKDGERVRAFSSICPHMGAQMCVESGGAKLTCPWHGLAFQTAGGSNHHRYRQLREFPVEVEGNRVRVFEDQVETGD